MSHASKQLFQWLARVSAISFFLSLSAYSGDSESTNYKSGIDLDFSGRRGVDYAEEYLYHDKLISDRKVVYLKGSTIISMSHNERNVARVSGSGYSVIGVNGLDGRPDSGDEGVIRYRIDGDLHWGPQWSSGQGAITNTKYEAPVSFSELKYLDGRSVLGRTGTNGLPINQKTSYYTYGLLDPFGNEWHTIQVADDDWNVTNTDTEWRASDGKVYHFVVDPKTPCLTWRAAGGAQFYTTPPKAYFIPKVHSQTTYISSNGGSLSLEITDINGNNVFYRVIKEGQVGLPFTNSGSKTVMLSANDFPLGASTLECYYEGSSSNVLKRVVVREPTWPSARENRGNLLVGREENMPVLRNRISKEPYAWHWDRLVKGLTGNRVEWDSQFRKGLRIVPAGALSNALLVRMLGANARQSGQAKTYAQYTKEMILENSRTIDSVGFEISHSQSTLPSRELNYRGYYDVGTMYGLAYAYDIVASEYRSDKFAGGLTPIEDYFVRDCIAQYVVECLMFSARMYSSAMTSDDGGMWDVARKCGAVVCMLAIPTYSTPYYGTNGLDGNFNAYTHTPFPNDALTWKAALLDKSTPIKGYPGLSNRLGVDEYNCNSDGHFIDRLAYAGHMGRAFLPMANTVAVHYPTLQLPNMVKFFERATEGTLRGLKDNSGPGRSIFLPMMNSSFPSVASLGVPYVTGLANSLADSDNQAINGVFEYALAWYDVDYNAPISLPLAPSNLFVK